MRDYVIVNPALRALYWLNAAKRVLSIDNRGDSCTGAEWNAGAQRILGYSAAEILHTSGDVVFTPEDRANGAPSAEQDRAAQDGRAEDERWHLRKDGTRFYASGVLSLVPDAAGTPIGYVKVLQDLTERRRAAEALARSEERYRLLVDSIKDYAIFMLDPAGRVLSWTAAAHRVLGYTEAEAVGQPFSILFTAHDRSKQVPEQELEAALTTGRVSGRIITG